VGYRIGIDVGGTFTDFIRVAPSGALALSKVPTTLPDQSEGVMRGIEALARDEGMSLRGFLQATDLVVSGAATRRASGTRRSRRRSRSRGAATASGCPSGSTSAGRS
jgi:N-methylhydantoinase A